MSLYRLTFIFITALLSAFGIAQASKQLTAKQIYDKWSDSVVTISAGTSTGTGFFDSIGHLYTAYHVVKDAKTISIKFPDGTIAPVKGFVACDIEADIAILRTGIYKGRQSKELGPKLGDYSELKVGAPLTVIGSPLGLSGSITEGLVSGKRENGGQSLLQLSASISPGSSGSPVFNNHGEVVAMVDGFLPGGQQLNFAISSKDLKSTDCVLLESIPTTKRSNSSIDSGSKPESLITRPLKAEIDSIRLNTAGLVGIVDTPILVENLGEDVKQDLTREDVEIWVRKQCTESGLKIVTTQDQEKSFLSESPKSELETLFWLDRGYRYLYINIFTMKTSSGMLFYNVEVQMKRRGLIFPGYFSTISTWSTGGGGFAGSNYSPRDELRKEVEREIAKFLDCWTIANKH